MYKTILFDFDGTLVSSLEIWLEGYKHAFLSMGQPLAESEIIETCFYKSERDIVARHKLSCMKTFWGLVAERLASLSPEIFPGVRELLHYCGEQNLAIGLVTSSEKAFVHRMFKELEIGNHFSAVITANDIINFKPHPEPVLKAMERLAASPSQTLFIGDNAVDVRAGQAAGVDTAVFFSEEHHGRFHQYNDLSECQPTFMFSDYGELQKRLKRILATGEHIASGLME